MTKKATEKILNEFLTDFSAKFINKCRSNGRCNYNGTFKFGKCPKYLYPVGGSMYCTRSIVNFFADVMYHINNRNDNVLKLVSIDATIIKTNSKNICDKECTKNKYCIMYINKKFDGLFCLKALKTGFVNYIKPKMIKKPATNKTQKPIINGTKFNKPFTSTEFMTDFEHTLLFRDNE